jgi:3-phenylpropionate/cinnamic acid dioxygenase small subunit
MSVTLEQKLAIHELLSRASYAYDVRDLDMLASCFSANASLTMRIAGGDLAGPFEGRKAIMALMSGAMEEQTDVRRHVVSNIFFDSSDEETIVNSFLTLIATENSETRLLSAGMYRDTVIEDEAGDWRLARRHIELDNAY